MAESTSRLSVPPEGIRVRDVILRFPSLDDVDGVATTIARMLAEHAFSLGIERVAAYVNVGNTESERVVDRARVHTRGRRPLDAETGWATHRQDALLTAPW